MTIQAILYDQNGNKVTPSASQTSVGGVPGLFYMALQITTTNIGNVPLESIRMTESHEQEFTQALQGQVAISPNLAVGASNVLQWNTANPCPNGDSDCGDSEVCVYTKSIIPNGDYCLMDISNYLGEKTFGATILADYKDAQGTQYSIDPVTINIAFNFEQDEVIFRTSAVNGDYSESGNQIAVDKVSGGVLEVYTRVGSGLESTYNPSTFITWTVQDNLVFNCFTDRVCVSRATGLDKDIVHTNVNRDYYDLGGSIPTTKTPTENYKSINCGGLMPCQERYSIAVSPPTQTCGNNIREGTEDCDGTDLGGAVCDDLLPGTTGDLACIDCTFDISDCDGGEPPTGDVIFRTLDQSYSSGGIAFADTCGQTLTKYGHETGMSHTAYECENNANFASGSQCATNPECLIMTGLPYAGTFGSGSTLSGDDYRLYQDDSDADEVWVCVNDVDGDGCWAARFDTGATTTVSTSASSIDPDYELAC